MAYGRKKKKSGVSIRKHNALKKQFEGFKKLVYGIVTLGVLGGGGFFFWKSKTKKV